MFKEDILDKNRNIEREWRKKVSSITNNKEMKMRNISGIEIKPVYSPEDIKDIDYNNITFPGEYPFTRGNYPLHYQIMPFMMTQGYGFGTADETRKRREWLSRLGSRLYIGKEEEATVYVLTCDLPTQRGYDPDEEEARGRVGECGLSISTPKDFEILFEGLPLEKVFTIIIGFDTTLVLTALWAAYVLDIRKESVEKMFHIACNLYHHQWFWDSIAIPPNIAMKLSTEFIKWNIENCPLSFPGIIDGYNVGEAGATPVQEAAFNLSHTIASIEECIKVGLDPDLVASKFYGHPHIGMNLFEEVAKIRAMRRIWAKTMKERFGCKTKEALMYKPFVAQTAGIELTAQEPINNIIRTTVMALTCMFSDIEGAWISSYDEAIGIPTEEAVQVCVRTYQILSEETDIPYVTDPLGGSYYVEWLTNRMEGEILKLLKRIEDMGGYLKCWESGWVRSEVERSAYERLKRLESGEGVKVGVNRYRVEEFPKIPKFEVSKEVEESAIERVRRYRGERDVDRVKDALNRVRDAAFRIEKEWPESCGVLMPALIDAARAGATTGEMHRILREVFGYGYYSG
jgi:methylmalonyl-CoA mutase N-terminal domain/subunit